MRNAILLPAVLILVSYTSGAVAAPAGEIAGLGKRLQAFVSAAVRGDRAEAQSLLANDPMFQPLREGGDIAAFESFVDRRLPSILAEHYPGQRETEIVPLAARIHADSFGTFHLMAKFYPAPALFTFSVYKQRDAWWVLNMRFINGAEDVAGEVGAN